MRWGTAAPCSLAGEHFNAIANQTTNVIMPTPVTITAANVKSLRLENTCPSLQGQDVSRLPSVSGSL